MDYGTESLNRHRKLRGTLSVTPKVNISSRDDLSTYYTPGIAAVSQAIAAHQEEEWELTWRGNTVAIISDGSAVLGLGNIGPAAAQPVMEGKAILFKEFANIDAVPIVLDTQDPDKIISTVKHIAPSFGSINLEDFSAPRCFAIEAALQDLGIPVMHDDQHGTAVVVLAGLLNACAVTGRDLAKSRIVFSGAGAAGTAIASLIREYTQGAATLLLTDRHGLIYEGRPDLNEEKMKLAAETNRNKESGSLADALHNSDIFIGVSQGGLLKPEMIASMAKDPIIFALANPTPEIMPEEAEAAGAGVMATGRSDYPNQVNNVLAFPGIFRGALDSRAKRITTPMLLAAAQALAGCTSNPSATAILPSPLDKGVVPAVAQAVANASQK